jgi:hypothetical protein
MAEEAVIIEMNIAKFQEMLKRDLSTESRSAVERMLPEAKRDLAQAKASRPRATVC